MKVRVQNYQTSKDTELDVRGFTVIVGKSNTGKTALLRAIEGSMFNDSVTGRVREGERNTIVTVEHEDISWTWKKGEDYNDYIVTTPKGTQEYSRVGRNSPKEIAAAGFKEWRVDGEKARPQIAAWHQPIFLLNKTGKVVTELMTAVTRLDVVNLAIRNCGSEIRKNRQTLKVREEDLKKAEARAREYDVLADMAVETIEGLWDDYQTLKRRLAEIEGFIDRYDKVTAAVDALAELDDVKVPKRLSMKLPDSIDTLAKWGSKLGAINATLSAYEVLEDVRVPSPITVPDSISQIDGWIKRLEEADSGLEALEPLDTVVVPTVDLDSLVGRVTAVRGYIKRVVTVGKELKDLKAEIREAEKRLDADLQSLDELRGQIDECPVCGRS